jgi:hypothetical protein
MKETGSDRSVQYVDCCSEGTRVYLIGKFNYPIPSVSEPTCFLLPHSIAEVCGSLSHL